VGRPRKIVNVEGTTTVVGGVVTEDQKGVKMVGGGFITYGVNPSKEVVGKFDVVCVEYNHDKVGNVTVVLGGVSPFKAFEEFKYRVMLAGYGKRSVNGEVNENK